MLVLGLETSCDETGVALYDTEKGLVGEALHSQVDLHAVYGGVVPEIASRDHLRRLLPLIQQVLSDGNAERPDAIAYTAGPGLVGALMVGAGMASGLGLAWGCPVVPVHHMEGHLLAPMLEDEPPAVAVPGAAGIRRTLRCSYGWRSWAVIHGNGNAPWMMRSAKRSTRPRSCWAWVTRVARRWRKLAEERRRTVRSTFPGR